ncbi:MAG: hypothetical protein QM777_08900 [Pseudorhodoferax sp.]
MIELIATKSLSYGGERREEGDPFQAKPRDARLLVAIGKAKHAPSAPPAAAPAPTPAPADAKAKGAPARREAKAKA